MDLYDIYKVVTTTLRSTLKKKLQRNLCFGDSLCPRLGPETYAFRSLSSISQRPPRSKLTPGHDRSFHIPSKSLFSARPVIRCHIIRYTITVAQYTTNEIKYLATVNRYQLMRVRNCTPTDPTCLQGTTVRGGKQAKYLNWSQECFISRTKT